MPDYFEGDHAVAITPSDTADLEPTIKKIYVGGTGAIALITLAGETVTFAAVPVGLFNPGCRIKRVLSTGTAATNLIGIY